MLTLSPVEPQPIAKSYPQSLVFKQANIAAVAVGTRKDAIECLEFAARGIVKTHFRTEKMEKLTEVNEMAFYIACLQRITDEASQVFQEMKEGKLIGRVVLDLE
jgi:propanol-preferring alcohol dehydrogenase